MQDCKHSTQITVRSISWESTHQAIKNILQYSQGVSKVVHLAQLHCSMSFITGILEEKKRLFKKKHLNLCS